MGVLAVSPHDCYDQEEDFSTHSDTKIDLHRAIVQLPTMQRIAVLKWMRDEKMSAAERMAFTRAKRNLEKVLQNG